MVPFADLPSNVVALVDGSNRPVLPCQTWNPAQQNVAPEPHTDWPCDATGQCGTVSWKALDWATESEVGSPTTKFILHLLANKADENSSCYPSIRTLMAESGAGRGTVMRALKELEASGLITRQAQFHDSGARRSSRYYLNHPSAPHYLPRPDPEPPRPDSKPPLFQGETGGVSGRHHPGGVRSGPLEPPRRIPHPNQYAMRVLRAMPEPWRVGGSDAQRLVPPSRRLDIRLDGQQLGGPSCARPQGGPKPSAGPGSASR